MFPYDCVGVEYRGMAWYGRCMECECEGRVASVAWEEACGQRASLVGEKSPSSIVVCWYGVHEAGETRQQNGVNKTSFTNQHTTIKQGIILMVPWMD